MDNNEAINEATETFNDLLQVYSSIDEARINKVPFEGSWTAAQLAQHIILSAGGFVQLLNGPVEDTDRDPEANVPNLRATFLNFNIKMKSPEFIVPEAKEYDKQQLAHQLEGIETDFLKAIETLDTTKTCTSFELPNSGYITRAEAITFTIVHTKRHVHQLKHIREELTAN